MALTQTQVYQIRHAASLGQAKLMAGAWGASDQQLADILRGSGLETILINIAKQHEEAGTLIPKQSQDIIKLTETFPSKTMYTAWGGVATTPTLEITDKIRTAQSFSQAQTLAKSYGIKDTELSKILKGSWLEDIAGRELPPPVDIGAEPSVIPTATIGITKPELDRIAKAKAAGQCVGAMKAYYAVKTYNVRLKDGSTILVEALDKESAERKAEDAGHQVAWVTKQFGEIKPEEIKGKELTKSQQWVKDYLIEKGAWSDDYLLGDGYNIVLMYKDSLESGTNISQSDLQKIFGKDAVKDARVLLKDNVVLPNGMLIAKDDFEAVPAKYQEVLKKDGYDAFRKVFEADHIKLVDDQWVSRKDWEELKKIDESLGTNYTVVGIEQGYAAMSKVLEIDQEKYEELESKVEAGEIIALPDGKYIVQSDFEGLPDGTQQLLKEGGFEALEDATTRKWVNIANPSIIIVDAELTILKNAWDKKVRRLISERKTMNEILTTAGPDPRSKFQLTPESSKRLLMQVASMVIPPIKAGLPEYTIKDISAIDWAFTAINVALIGLAFAPGAIVGAVAVAGKGVSVTGRGLIVGLTATQSGLISYTTAKNWADLTPAQRGIGVGIAVLCAIPLITTVARNVKISPSQPIPTTKGNIISWKGLSVAGHPIIGRSGGKWVLGTRNLTIPEARLILDGYKPEMMLETKVFVNVKALKQAGFTQVQVDYLRKTLKTRNLFAGKSSLWLDKDVLIEPTARLNANEINIVMRHIVKHSKNVKGAQLLYGSPTIKAQLAPGLRGWRDIHDWDISLNLNQAKTETFTMMLFKELKTGGGGTYRISPKSSTLIQKLIEGKWTHIADIHSKEVVSIGSAVDIPHSKLDATGEYSYGRMVTEPSITVNYPGIGKIEIMRLSESGVRKADTILRVRQTAAGTAFRPPERGIAQPGVPKDAADYYVTLRTFLGEDVAEDWLKYWAKAMGYTTTELAKVLPKIRIAMLEVAAQTPSDIIGYRFTPAKSIAVSPSASPNIIIHVPSSLGASVPSSLEGIISTPIYPYKVAGSAGRYSLQAISNLVSQYPKLSPSAPSAPPSVKATLSSGASLPSYAVKPSVAPSKAPSVSVRAAYSVSASPSISPKPSPSVSPKPSPSVSPKPSPVVSPSRKLSAVPSPLPSVVPSPAPYPAPFPKAPKPVPPLLISVKGKKYYKIAQGSIAWKQGLFWKYIPPPWRQEKPITIKHPPIGAQFIGSKTPKETIQMIGKSKAKVPKSVSVDLGVVDILIEDYGRKIRFTGEGEKTVVGHSLGSATKGMSIPGTTPMKVAKNNVKSKRRRNSNKRKELVRSASAG